MHHAITLSALVVLSPILLNAASDPKSERRRPPQADSARSDRDGGNAQLRHAKREHGKRGGSLMAHILQNDRAAKSVGLSDEQRSQLKAAAESGAQERKTLHAKMKEAAMAQARLLTDSDVDESALMAAVEKTGAIRTELAKVEMRGLLATRKILTDEQRQKIRHMMKQRMSERENMLRSDRRSPNRDGDYTDHPHKTRKSPNDKSSRKAPETTDANE